MTHLTAYLIACPLLLWALWLRYVTVMHFMKVRRAGRLTKPALVLGFLPSIAGVVLDVFVNFAYGYLLTLTLPRWGEWTVTAHLQRLYDNPGWRGSMARWVCTQLLDDFDPDGCHCK